MRAMGADVDYNGAVKMAARMRVTHIIAAIIVALLTTSISAPAPSSAVAETRIHVPWGAQVIAEYIAPDSEGENPKLVKRLYWADGADQLLGYDADQDTPDGLEKSYSVLTDEQGTVHSVIDNDEYVDVRLRGCSSLYK